MEAVYRDILHRCFRCGWCKLPLNYADINCPAYEKYRFESFSAGGRMWLIRAWQEGEVEAGDRLAQVLFSCVTCKNCVETCAIAGIKDLLVDVFIDARADMVEKGRIPPRVRDYLKAMAVFGNPYKMTDERRADWADGLGLRPYDRQECLFYVGDVGAFDDLGRKMARSVAETMTRAGVSFGILGEREISDGNDVLALGEKGLAASLAERNVGLMNGLGVKNVVTLSPHAFHAMKNRYPLHGATFRVFHYTQVLQGFVDRISGNRAVKSAVTFHDPCYLGRWNGEYAAPRNILRAAHGVRPVEMERSLNNALCCGGGGGNFYTDMLGTGPDLSARARIREALAAGADTIAVACPQCYRMLSDAVKDEGAAGRIRVCEVTEVLAGVCV